MKSEDFSDLDVHVKPIDWFKPDPRNARRHPESQIEKLMAAIKRYGVRWPAMARKSGKLIVGHGRTEAARRMGYDHFPTFLAPKGWTDKKCREFMIADNQQALNGEWDFDILRDEYLDLGIEDNDALIDAIGFDEDSIDEIFRSITGGDEEEEPPMPAPPADHVTQSGDVWILGKHRLICGDSTDAETVSALFAGAEPNLMVTDPPYGVEYDADWRNRAARTSEGMGNRYMGAGAVGKVTNDDRADWREAWALFPGDVAYVWHSSLHRKIVEESLLASDFSVHAEIVWVKPVHVIGRGHYHWQHEPCLYAWRKKGRWAGDRKQSTVWEIKNMHATQGDVDDGKTEHSTQKPVECMARPIRNNSKRGQSVYDPFCGSGTTIIASELEGRVCYAVELEPNYCDVIVERFQNKFEVAVTREADGVLFDQLKSQKGDR